MKTIVIISEYRTPVDGDPTKQFVNLVFRFPVPSHAQKKVANQNRTNLWTYPPPTQEEIDEVKTGKVLEEEFLLTFPASNTNNQVSAAAQAAYNAELNEFNSKVPAAPTPIYGASFDGTSWTLVPPS